MTARVFRDYRVGDRVRVTSADGRVSVGLVFGNVGGELIYVEDGETRACRVPYVRVQLVEPTPEWPLERRSRDVVVREP